MLHRAAFLAILVYVTLDLSLPAMPGAFVFEPEESVESTQLSRGRSAPEVVALAPLARDSVAPSTPVVPLPERIAPAHEVPHRERLAARWRPRTTLDAPSPSEDPH